MLTLAQPTHPWTLSQYHDRKRVKSLIRALKVAYEEDLSLDCVNGGKLEQDGGGGQEWDWSPLGKS